VLKRGPNLTNTPLPPPPPTRILRTSENQMRLLNASAHQRKVQSGIELEDVKAEARAEAVDGHLSGYWGGSSLILAHTKDY